MSLVIHVKVVPASNCSQWLLSTEGKLICYVKSAAQDGAANRELIKLLAKKCNVIQADVEIIVGRTSRNKVIKIHTGSTYAQLLICLGLVQQHSII